MTFTRRIACVLLPIALAAGSAAAQASDRPPAVKDVGNAPLILMTGLFFVLVAVAVVANTIPSKRGHQD